MARNKKLPFEYRADETFKGMHKRFLRHWSYLKNKRFLNRLFKLFLTDYVEYVKFECGYSVRIPGSYDVIMLNEDFEIQNFWYVAAVTPV